MSGDNDDELGEVAQKLLSEMIDDMVLSIAISAHREIKRSRVPCNICGTNCRGHSSSLLSTPLANGAISNSIAGPSSARSPGAPYAVGPEKGTGGNTGIGSGSGKPDGNGNVFFDCLVCGRSTASSRYAPHLSSCLGLNGGTRRKAARAATAKNRLGANDRSSPSPYYQASDNGDSDGESTATTTTKKGKKLNANGKRARSPSSIPKSRPGSGSSTPTSTLPSAKPALPPSRLGQPPTSRETLDLTSSPDDSTALANRGSVGAKTLPGQVGGVVVDLTGGGNTAAGAIAVDPGSDSSEDADDY